MESDLTYQELEKLYHEGKAICVNDRITRRDFLYNGFIYSCGWSSERNSEGTGVIGWIVGKQYKEG